MERRLAAILAADVVGYSRLMEVDEASTLARLKTHRLEQIDPVIANNRGNIIKTTGDGLLVEFASVTDAVACAVELMLAFSLAFTVMPPAAPSMVARDTYASTRLLMVLSASATPMAADPPTRATEPATEILPPPAPEAAA